MNHCPDKDFIDFIDVSKQNHIYKSYLLFSHNIAQYLKMIFNYVFYIEMFRMEGREQDDA